MNNHNQFEEVDDGGVSIMGTTTLAAVTKAEIDQAIATAKAYPRQLRAVMQDAKTLVTSSQDMAEACIYALPRRDENGKAVTISGPSARFAEVLQYCYGNNRGGGRVIAEDNGFIVAEGVYHDLEKNVHVSMQVRRRITNRNGQKFKADMIMVTGNAAASIAHRNAVLKGIPKAVWLPLYEAARAVSIGDAATLTDRRLRALQVYQTMGATKEMVYAKLGIKGDEDFTLDHLELLVGLRTAIREGTTTIDKEFAEEREAPPGGTTGGLADVAATLAAKRDQKAATADKATAATPAAVEPGEASLGDSTQQETASGGAGEAVQAESGGQVDHGELEITVDGVIASIRKATDRDALDEAYDLVRHLSKSERQLATDVYNQRAAELGEE